MFEGPIVYFKAYYYIWFLYLVGALMEHFLEGVKLVTFITRHSISNLSHQKYMAIGPYRQASSLTPSFIYKYSFLDFRARNPKVTGMVLYINDVTQ